MIYQILLFLSILIVFSTTNATENEKNKKQEFNMKYNKENFIVEQNLKNDKYKKINIEEYYDIIEEIKEIDKTEEDLKNEKHKEIEEGINTIIEETERKIKNDKLEIEEEMKEEIERIKNYNFDKAFYKLVDKMDKELIKKEIKIKNEITEKERKNHDKEIEEINETIKEYKIIEKKHEESIIFNGMFQYLHDINNLNHMDEIHLTKIGDFYKKYSNEIEAKKYYDMAKNFPLHILNYHLSRGNIKDFLGVSKIYKEDVEKITTLELPKEVNDDDLEMIVKMYPNIQILTVNSMMKGTAKGLEEINQLVNLTTLRLNHTFNNEEGKTDKRKIGAFVKILPFLKKLRSLTIVGDTLGPDEIGELNKIFTNLTFKSSTFNKLMTLNLKENKIGDEGAGPLSNFLKNFKNLMNLYIENNGISSEGARKITDALTETKTLRLLSLSGNKIQQNIESIISNLRKIETLEFLYFENNGINSKVGMGFKAFKKKSSLKSLNLGDNQIEKDAENSLKRSLPNIEVLFNTYKN